MIFNHITVLAQYFFQNLHKPLPRRFAPQLQKMPYYFICNRFPNFLQKSVASRGQLWTMRVSQPFFAQQLDDDISLSIELRFLKTFGGFGHENWKYTKFKDITLLQETHKITHTACRKPWNTCMEHSVPHIYASHFIENVPIT